MHRRVCVCEHLCEDKAATNHPYPSKCRATNKMHERLAKDHERFALRESLTQPELTEHRATSAKVIEHTPTWMYTTLQIEWNPK